MADLVMPVATRSTWREQAPLYLAGAAAATSVVSIAGSEILLALAFVAVLAARDKWRWPPVVWPVALWMGWTLVSLAASGHARGGLPQVRKFYVYLMLFVVYSTLRSLKDVRILVISWAAGAGLSSLWGFGQFIHKYLTTPRYFYYAYENERITGFVDHWMTFSSLIMLALMMLGALLLFSRERKWFWWLTAAATVISVALLLAHTRSMWLGAAAGAVWLLWFKKRWLVIAVPVLAAIVLLVNPFEVRERTLAALRPQPGVLDASAHRSTLRRAGWEMIKAHPLVGVGPEQVGPQFMDYLPADIPRPIPSEWYYQHLHNIYFHFAAERGLPALAALLWVFGQSLLDFSRALRRLQSGSEARWILHGAIAAIIAILVSGWGEVNVGHSQVLEMFLAVIACGYIAVDVSRSDLQKAGR
ncbi:MAG: O-antigen polymerase [Bryobacterales bacterium]|jgi:O-antigen ligase|nr:O-antigen polymerase [Bryobacterales bacterium]